MRKRTKLAGMSILKNFKLPEEMVLALQKTAKREKVTESDLVRQGIAARLGHPELAEIIKLGRPPYKKRNP